MKACNTIVYATCLLILCSSMLDAQDIVSFSGSSSTESYFYQKAVLSSGQFLSMGSRISLSEGIVTDGSMISTPLVNLAGQSLCTSMTRPGVLPGEFSFFGERDPARIHQTIGGIGLATSYVATIIVDLAAYPEDDYLGWLFVPVAGPFLHLAIAGKDYYWDDTARYLLILSGVGQTAFATSFVISTIIRSKHEAEKKVSVTSSLNTMGIKVVF